MISISELAQINKIVSKFNVECSLSNLSIKDQVRNICRCFILSKDYENFVVDTKEYILQRSSKDIENIFDFSAKIWKSLIICLIDKLLQRSSIPKEKFVFGRDDDYITIFLEELAKYNTICKLDEWFKNIIRREENAARKKIIDECFPEYSFIYIPCHTVVNISEWKKRTCPSGYQEYIICISACETKLLTYMSSNNLALNITKENITEMADATNRFDIGIELIKCSVKDIILRTDKRIIAVSSYNHYQTYRLKLIRCFNDIYGDNIETCKLFALFDLKIREKMFENPFDRMITYPPKEYLEFDEFIKYKDYGVKIQKVMKAVLWTINPALIEQFNHQLVVKET
jgi:hypothetical protein